jgi:hypothetical protein
MKKYPGTLLLLSSSVLIPFGGCARNKRVNEYGYVFQESTGQNQYILIEGRKTPVKFDSASNQIALKSLYALKAGILYENRKGDQIFVTGEYDERSQLFRLSHWYIKVPFEELVIDDETRVPHTVHKVTHQSLARTDFESKNGFDPNDPAFDPKFFEKAAR